jgi:hypothetical protein
MSDEVEDVEAQPTGVSIEKTLDVVGCILSDPEFAERVADHNEWVEGLDQKDIAILFLASRYHGAVDLFVLRTNTLKREFDGLATQLADLEGLVRGQQ